MELRLIRNVFVSVRSRDGLVVLENVRDVGSERTSFVAEQRRKVHVFPKRA